MTDSFAVRTDTCKLWHTLTPVVYVLIKSADEVLKKTDTFFLQKMHLMIFLRTYNNETQRIRNRIKFFKLILVSKNIFHRVILNVFTIGPMNMNFIRWTKHKCCHWHILAWVICIPFGRAYLMAYVMNCITCTCMIFVCLVFGVYRPTRKFFTHMETSPLPVKDCKFWSMLGTHGHWAVRVLKRATPTANLGIRL